jgi:molybdopterin converting factor small subunit
MVVVRFSKHLTRHFNIPDTVEAVGENVSELISDLERQYPGVAAYIVHENGALRQHVNVFIGDRLIADRQHLTDSIDSENEVSIMQALSGG